MKRKTAALMTALTLVFSLSACGDKTASQAEIPDTTSGEETAETTENAKVTEEEIDRRANFRTLRLLSL